MLAYHDTEAKVNAPVWENLDCHIFHNSITIYLNRRALENVGHYGSVLRVATKQTIRTGL